VMAGNPTRTSGFFYDTHHSLRHHWHTMHVNCCPSSEFLGQRAAPIKRGSGSSG
jgi:hypothetical protein